METATVSVFVLIMTLWFSGVSEPQTKTQQFASQNACLVAGFEFQQYASDYTSVDYASWTCVTMTGTKKNQGT